MPKPNKRNRRHEQKALRRSKEIARRRDALEKKEEQFSQGAYEPEIMTGPGTLHITDDNKTIMYTEEGGTTEKHSITSVRMIPPQSKEYRKYIESGFDSGIPEGHVLVRLGTEDRGDESEMIASMEESDLDEYLDSSIPFEYGGAFSSPNGSNKSSADRGLIANQTIFTGHNHSVNTQEMLPLIIEQVHPGSRKVISASEAKNAFSSENLEEFAAQNNLKIKKELVKQAMHRIKHAGALDPNGEILIKEALRDALTQSYNPLNFYSSISEAEISPGIDNKELDLIHNLLTDPSTRRIRFDQLNYPVWEGHTAHPTRSEGFLTKPPFPKMYIQFGDFVNLPQMSSEYLLIGSELYSPTFDDMVEYQFSDMDIPLFNHEKFQDSFKKGQINREMSVSIGAMAFSETVQHFPIQINSSGTNRTILPSEGEEWKITSPLGTSSRYNGYSAERNDSITLGYLHWFGLLMDSNHHGLAQINQGAYFDINTGTVWLPLTKINGGPNSILQEDVIKGESGKGNIFGLGRDRMVTHLIPAGSGIESSNLPKGWDSDRSLNIFEDTSMRVGDMFMFMMNYMTSPRMQTEEVQAPRAERRRAEKSGSPPPPPWTTIAYKPPSNIKRNSVATGTGAKHSYMYDVRGHWKNQPHGPRNSLRKLIWIDNHYSGLGNDTYIPRNRLVDEKEEFEIED